MLKITNVCDALPINFTVDKAATFYPGQMAQLKAIGNEIVCGVSDGTSPCGIIDDINDDANNSTVTSGRICVWSHFGIFETDQYDSTQRYTKGAKLYCNKYGKFTTFNLSNSCPSVAIVTRKPIKENLTLEFVWK